MINKTAGARFYIGPTLVPSTVNAMDDAAALAYFEAIITGDWTEVEEIENFGDLGDSAQAINFTAVKDGRVRKLKGPKDAGTMQIVVAVDELDEGQVALVAAEKTDFNYAFKIVYADERDEGYSPTTDYFGGLVMSRAKTIGGASDVTKRTFMIGVNTSVYTDATDPTGS
jgi:hypothetical protein